MSRSNPKQMSEANASKDVPPFESRNARNLKSEKLRSYKILQRRIDFSGICKNVRRKL